MSSTRTIFLPKGRYRELVRLALWYTSTPADLFELFGDTLVETVNQNLGELALGPSYGDAQVEDRDWLEGWAVRRGVVYADSHELGRVRFAVKPTNRGRRPARRYSNRLITPAQRFLEDGGTEL